MTVHVGAEGQVGSDVDAGWTGRARDLAGLARRAVGELEPVRAGVGGTGPAADVPLEQPLEWRRSPLFECEQQRLLRC